MTYQSVKLIHVTCVVLTLTLFLLRSAWALQGSPRLQQRWAKVVPHVIDTVLLASAIWLAYQLGQAPLRDSWLTAKLVGLLVYIATGTYVIKRARTQPGRLLALILALITFAYIVGVALTKNPLPILPG
ncbi:MAG TPA: SirB2 family protein [Burkholderiales bacterium]|nr:SirB2 family protein [Burkholderiales bacterium]